MAITIKHKPIYQTYQLEWEEETAPITVFQADEGANRRRSELFSSSDRIFDQDDRDAVIVRTTYNAREVKRMEAYQTLGECELFRENGTPYFKTRDTGTGARVRFGMSEREFNEAWDALPSPITDQLSTFVRTLNSTWGN